jgi:hypothetical protein
VTSLFRDMLLDMAVILVVALVISVELTLYLAGSGVLRPLGVIAYSLRSAALGQFRAVRTSPASGEAQGLLADLSGAIDSLQMRRETLKKAIAARWPHRHEDGATRARLSAALSWLKQASHGYSLPHVPVPQVGRFNTANALGVMRAPFFCSSSPRTCRDRSCPSSPDRCRPGASTSRRISW